MKYEMLFAEQFRKAIEKNTPVVLPVGVLEYHAEQCVFGLDTLVIIKALEVIEKEMDIIVLPPFYYGSASYAVERAENGTIHIPSHTVYLLAKDLFRGLLKTGLRNIHAFVHHQADNFFTGMPTDLALRLAAKETLFAYIEERWGEGWWGNGTLEKNSAEDKRNLNPLDWIKIHPFMDAETQKQFPGDHAGKLETSLMLAFCPEGADMKRLSEKKWYSAGAKDASKEYGAAAGEMIISRMKQLLKE